MRIARRRAGHSDRQGLHSELHAIPRSDEDRGRPICGPACARRTAPDCSRQRADPPP